MDERPVARSSLCDHDTRIELLRREIRHLTEKLGRTELGMRQLEHRNQELRRKLERIREHPAGRVALRLAAVLRPLRLAASRKPRPEARRRTKSRASALKEQALIVRLTDQRTGAGVRSGPLVSIVVLTHNGAHHMQRLLGGLRDRCQYRPFEVVVVDNASTDGTPAILEAPWQFPLRVVRNKTNVSFSTGNNQALTEAKGDLILLLNNDVEPINPNWLGAMVETLLASPGHGAVGALLVYPRRNPADLQGDVTYPDLTIQHRGIAFHWAEDAPRARNLGGGEDPRDQALAKDRTVPAVTAAALLVRRDMLIQVGGLTEGYMYGTEDVDLCLKLRALGKEIVYCGGAALFHHEFGTQSTTERGTKVANRRRNAQIFVGTWGPTLARTMRLDVIGGSGFWSGGRPPTIAITVTEDDPTAGWGDWYTAHELGDAMTTLGWNVIYAEAYGNRWFQLHDNTDVVLVLLDRYDIAKAPSGAIKVAWVRNWADRWMARPWFEDFDMVFASSKRTAEMIAAASSHEPVVMPLAANDSRFRPVDARPELESNFVVTANNWGLGRRIIDRIEVREGERFGLYGRGWESDERVAAVWRGHVPFERMPELYSSTDIVIDDSAEHTMPYASVNSRVFEAIACGALVTSNDVAGSSELFGDALPTYTTAGELRAVLDRFLGDEELRRRTVEQLRGIVLERHTYARRAEQLTAELRRFVEAPRIGLRTCAPDRARSESWGDTHFARQFARSLRGLGFAVTIRDRSQWDKLSEQDSDVVVHMLGDQMYVPKPGALNVLWVISHPDDLSPLECELYDLVCVASRAYAARLGDAIDVPVHVLNQATNVDRFAPVPADPELHAEVLFVGNSRKHSRHTELRCGVQWAVELKVKLRIWGENWENVVPSELVRGTYFPNERLAALYCSADIVLNDHWPDMRAHGFVSNRIFDALACGAFLLSDSVEGIDELFGGAVPTFDSKEELASLFERYLADPAERRRLAALGMERVRERHSFDARAREFADIVRPLLAMRAQTMEDHRRGQTEFEDSSPIPRKA